MPPSISMADPGSESFEEDESLIVIPIDRTFSDGDSSFWPSEPRFQMADDTGYRQKLALRWVKETGTYEQGMEYILDALPEGYVMFERPRGTNPSILDKFLFGHPCGQYFDSTIKFYPHFYYLMTGGAGTCPCVNCDKLKKLKRRSDESIDRGNIRGRPPSSGKLGRPISKLPGRPAGRPSGRIGRPLGRPPGRAAGRPRCPVVDREGTPDVYKLNIRKLSEVGALDKNIEEPESMDWKAEHSLLEEHLERISMQQAYIPRLGEIVLWTPSFEGELRWNPEAGRIGVYSPEKERFAAAPQWRAGIVTQTPREDTTLYDIVETSKKHLEVNYSGFRVETFPDPLSADKSYSLHYNYVHLKCVKPFNAFEVFLQGIPREAFHPSIEYAMTVMSSFSLVKKKRFKGTWPDASVYCKAMFLGAELLRLGDAVKLKPTGCTTETALQSSAMDILVIDEIRLDLVSCIDDFNSRHMAENYRVRLRGKVYTNSPIRVWTIDSTNPPQPMSHDDVIFAFQYTGMSGYGDWYRLHSGQPAEVSQDMVIGRCYEPDAMQIMFGSLSLSQDLHGVLMGRNYSRQTDERIGEGKHWFWGDYRTQTLAVDSLNGEEVGQYSEARDVKMWRANLRVIAGTETPGDLRDARLPGDLGRPPSKTQSTFGPVRKTSALVSAGLGVTDASNNVSSEENGRGVFSESEDEDVKDAVDESLFKRIQERSERSAGDDYTPEREGKRPRYV